MTASVTFVRDTDPYRCISGAAPVYRIRCYYLHHYLYQNSQSSLKSCIMLLEALARANRISNPVRRLSSGVKLLSWTNTIRRVFAHSMVAVRSFRRRWRMEGAEIVYEEKTKGRMAYTTASEKWIHKGEDCSLLLSANACCC